MRMIVAALAAALLLTGCETMTPQQREQLIAEGNREITCTAGVDCEAKWARVTQWIQANSHWKFRNVTDTLISTEGPFDTTYAAFEVTKVPVGDGTTYRLLLRAGCGNIFGCVPSIPQLRASFTQFVLGDSGSATANPTERAYIIEFAPQLKRTLVAARRGEQPQEIAASASDQSFEDDAINIKWDITPPRFRFDLGNRTGATARVIWDDAAIVYFGESQKVVRRGQDYANRTASQPPTAVLGGSNLREIVFPANAVIRDQNRWVLVVPFPTEIMDTKANTIRYGLPQGMTEDSLTAAVRSRNVGKEIRVLLPVEVAGTVREYTFVFEVADVRVRPVTVTEFQKLRTPDE